MTNSYSISRYTWKWSKNFQVVVFCVVMACSNVVQYQHFRGLCCLHLQGEFSEAWKWVYIQEREYERRQNSIWANRKWVRLVLLSGPQGRIKERSARVEPLRVN